MLNTVELNHRPLLLLCRRRESVHGYSSGLASDGSLTDSPLSKSPARRRRRLGSELSSSGYESMRDCTTSHVSGSDSADEKLMIPDSSNTGNVTIWLNYFLLYPSTFLPYRNVSQNTFLCSAYEIICRVLFLILSCGISDESRCIETVFSGSNRIEFERLYDIDERRVSDLISVSSLCAISIFFILSVTISHH